MIVPAYAKLNLTLDVLGRLPDGFHEIATVMQTVSLHDLLSVERADCRSFEATGERVDGENLVLAAARELEGWAGRTLPLRLRLHKRTPPGSGLGGGSADAAALLRLAVRVYRLPIPDETLLEIAGRLGKDVPFFLQGGTALATGDGSTVEPLPPLSPHVLFVIVWPQAPVSTRAVYEAYDRMASPPGTGRTGQLVDCVRRGAPAVTELMGNDLEPVTLQAFPDLRQTIDRLREQVPQLRMTGTGSAFYAALSERAEADAASQAARAAGLRSWVCRPVRGWSG